MKYNRFVTGSRRKQRKAHFTASSEGRRRRMCSKLAKELRVKHNARSLPIHKDDEVIIMRGEQKGREGKVVSVYRKKYKIYVEKITIEKINGSTVFIPIDASNCLITKIKMTKSRKAVLDRKAATRTKWEEFQGKKADKIQSEEATMSKIDL